MYAQLNPALQTKGSIKGVLVDSSTRKPVEAALVNVYPENSTTPVTQLITDNKGIILATDLIPGNYKMTIVLFGYKPIQKDSIRISTAKLNTNLGNILFASTAQQLKGVTITKSKNLVDNQPDKLVYHADNDITNAGGMALDVLKKVPEVAVDNQGNVELQGNSEILVLIDGKSSPATNGNLADVLQAIPADQIDRIEVITSPSAKYDAQGMGGIINIILKKSAAGGISSIINLSGGTRINKGTGAITYRQSKWQLGTNFSGNYYIPSTAINSSYRTSTNNDTTGTLSQNGTSLVGRYNLMAALNFNWDMTPKDNISIHASRYTFEHISDVTNSTVYGITGENNTQNVTGISNTVITYPETNINVDYKHVFDSAGRELDITANYSYNKDEEYADINQSLESSTVPVNPDNYLLDEQDTNVGKETLAVFGADYTQPLGKNTMLEVGGKVTLYNIVSSYAYNVFDTLTHAYTYDPTRSNVFTYNQNVYAGYASLSFKLLKHCHLITGLRYEYTDNNFYLQNSNTYTQTYGNLLPSIIISRKFGNNTLKVSYTYRLERAEFDRLNPFVAVTDGNTVSLGNPNMVPENQYKVDLSYSIVTPSGASFSTTLFYRDQKQDILSYTDIYPEYIVGNDTLHNVSVTEPFNAVEKRTPGISVFGSATLFKNLDIHGNASLMYDYMIILIYPSPPVTDIKYNVNATIDYFFPHEIVAEVFGLFNSPRYTFQGMQPSYSEYSIGIRKQFNHKKGSIGIFSTDPFNKYHNYITNISGTTFTEQSTSSVPYRTFGISFSYQLGVAIKQKAELPPTEDMKD